VTGLPRLVCATANPGKLAEIEAVLTGVVDLLPRPSEVPEVVEDAGTLVGNARLKARAICAATGLPAVADDTGLEVAALGGEPGVETAYFAGAQATDSDNRVKLLKELASAGDRSAVFRTVALVAYPDGSELIVEGVCAGQIATEERGGRGFGFDSLFIPGEGDGRTFAEMSEAEKLSVSHRGRAFQNLAARLADRTAD
jgi:XTP/dITP diphosphohydrolase